MVFMSMCVEHGFVFASVLGKDSADHGPVLLRCGLLTASRQVLSEVNENACRGGADFSDATANLFLSSVDGYLHIICHISSIS